MFKKLKENYIVHQSSYINMIIDRENQSHIEITPLESVIFSYLDGTKSIVDIYSAIIKTLNLDNESDDAITVMKNIELFFDKFDDLIQTVENKNKRNNFVMGGHDAIYPYEIGIELTDKCVMNCIHCYKCSSPLKNTFLDYNELISFLTKMQGKVDSIQLTGGEAMLHPNFFEILDFCKENFTNVSVSTTGLLINESNINKFINTKVYLSLYSFDKKANDSYVRNNKAYDEIMKKIPLLVKHNIHTCINTIANDNNYKEIENFITTCKELKVQGVGIGKLVKVGRGKKLCNSEFCSTENSCYLKKLGNQYDGKYDDMYVSMFSDSEDIDDYQIHCGLYKWIINEKGEILPCSFFIDDRFILSKITDEDISSIFTKEKYIGMIKKLEDWSKELKNENIKLVDICPSLVLVGKHEEE